MKCVNFLTALFKLQYYFSFVDCSLLSFHLVSVTIKFDHPKKPPMKNRVADYFEYWKLISLSFYITLRSSDWNRRSSCIINIKILINTFPPGILNGRWRISFPGSGVVHLWHVWKAVTGATKLIKYEISFPAWPLVFFSLCLRWRRKVRQWGNSKC